MYIKYICLVDATDLLDHLPPKKRLLYTSNDDNSCSDELCED